MAAEELVIPELNPHAWTASALCAQADPDAWYPEQHGPDTFRQAKALCRQCPVIGECAEYVMAYEGSQARALRFGVWAGMSPNDRYRLAEK